jgi:hypothetical protein
MAVQKASSSVGDWIGSNRRLRTWLRRRLLFWRLRWGFEWCVWLEEDRVAMADEEGYIRLCHLHRESWKGVLGQVIDIHQSKAKYCSFFHVLLIILHSSIWIKLWIRKDLDQSFPPPTAMKMAQHRNLMSHIHLASNNNGTLLTKTKKAKIPTNNSFLNLLNAYEPWTIDINWYF